MNFINVLNCESDIPESVSKDLLTAILNITCLALNLDYPVEVSLSFAEEAEMQKLNYKYRGVNNSTDILSFSSDKDLRNAFRADDNPVYIGELILDVNYMSKEYAEMGFNQALSKVFIHGILHLLDYDHLNAKQAELMRKTENIILCTLLKENIIER